MTSFVNAPRGMVLPARAADALLDLDEKLADLNRRALLCKLDTLARRWHSSALTGFQGFDESLRAAVSKHVIELFIGASTTERL